MQASGARRTLIRLAVGLFTTTALAVLPMVGATAAGAAPASVSSTEAAFVSKLNEARAANGLGPLQSDSRLASTSRDWSAHMQRTNTLAHDPHLASDVAAVEPAWRSAGENVGHGYSVTQLHDAFMASPGHRANILKPAYNRVGVGVALNGSEIWVTVRFLEGPALASSAPATGPSTRGAMVADFTGDGTEDVFVYGPGSLLDEFLESTAGGTFRKRAASVTGYYKPVAGDFDGDGRAEILWYGVGSVGDTLWEWTGTGWTSRPMSITGDYRPVAGDFDGDGNDDILWYGLGTRPDSIWWGTDTFGTFASGYVKVSGSYRMATGDLDGDGFDDVLLYGPGSQPDKILFGRGDRKLVQVTIGAGRDYRPAVGDLNGDGIADIVWYGPGGAEDAIWYMGAQRGSFTRVSRSAGGDHLPAMGDLDGDDVDDILWFSPSSAVGDTIWRGQPGSLTTQSASVST